MPLTNSMLCSLMAPLCSAGCGLKLSGGKRPSSGTMSTHAGSAAPPHRRIRSSGKLTKSGRYAQAWQGLYTVVLDGQQISNPAGWLTLVTFRRAIEEHRAHTRLSLGLVDRPDLGGANPSRPARAGTAHGCSQMLWMLKVKYSSSPGSLLSTFSALPTARSLRLVSKYVGSSLVWFMTERNLASVIRLSPPLISSKQLGSSFGRKRLRSCRMTDSGNSKCAQGTFVICIRWPPYGDFQSPPKPITSWPPGARSAAMSR